MEDLDFSSDQTVLDNTEAVTFTSVRTAGGETAAVASAGYYPQPVAEGAPSRGVYTKGRARFSIKAAELDAVGGAKPRDTVTLGTKVYTVLSAELGRITNVWQIDAICLALAADLRDTGGHYRPANARDDAGRPARATFAQVAGTGDIPCRVQPLGGQAGDVLDKRTIPQRFAAYVGTPLDARAGDQFRVGSTHYTIVGSSNPERIDELQVLTLEVVLP